MSGNKDLGCQKHRRCSPGSIKKKLRHEGFLDEAGFIDSDCVIYNEWKYLMLPSVFARKAGLSGVSLRAERLWVQTPMPPVDM